MMQAKIDQSNIEKITGKMPSSIQIARKIAMKKINQAYIDINVAKVTLSENARKLRGRVRKFDMVANTLNWSGSLTHNELQWLDGKIAEKPLAKLGPNYKSPIMLIYLIMSIYSAQLSDKKKKVISQLYILKNRLDGCKKMLYDFNSIKNDLKSEIGLDKLREEYSHLAHLLNLKIEQIEQEREDADILRNSVLSQGVLIFFNEWKMKTHDPDVQSERVKALKEAKEERHKRQTSHINAIVKKEKGKAPPPAAMLDHAANLKDDASNITPEDLEEMLKSFRSSLDDIMNKYMSSKGMGSRTLGQSYSFYCSPVFDGVNGCDVSPDLSPSFLSQTIVQTREKK